MVEKNLKKKKAKKNRVMVNFNTGSRIHKNKKDYNRQEEKLKILKKDVDE